MVEINRRNIRTWSMLGARGTFGMAVLELAKEKQDFMVVSADLANSTGLSRFMNSFPNQFLNVGIAEQNMIGVAAGIAKEGILTFAASFAPFITLRSCEQIRMNLGYMNLNVKAVGIGSGIAMGYLGNSHYGIEDVAVMRSVPNLTVINPADGAEIVKTVFACAESEKPMYIRLTGAANQPVVYQEDYEFQIGKAVALREGHDVGIVAAGTMVHESLEAARLLESSGISTAVVNMHTIKPLDTEVLDELFSECELIVTVEEHSIIGGLGSAVTEYKAGLTGTPPQLLLGLPDRFGKAGEYQYLLEHYGLKGRHIADRIKNKLKKEDL